MAKITKIEIIDESLDDHETKQWHWEGICPCGEKVSDTEIATERMMRINASVTVCRSCESAAYAADW